MQVGLNLGSTANRQVIVANRAKQEGLTRLDLTGIVRLEADGGLAVHPDSLIASILPLVEVGLHPRLAGGRVTIVDRLIIPLPRHAARNVGPGIVRLSVGTTKSGRDGSVARAHTILGHALDDAVTNEVVVVSRLICLRAIGNTFTHPGRDFADFNLAGRGLLRRIRSLRSNDLASNQCTTSGRRNG